MSLDAEAFIAAMGLQKPILIGHSMGGRNAMLLMRRNQALLRAAVIVDVGPELSEKGRAAIAGFVQANQEFDDLEHFVRNVRQYDPYRCREHIERTVKYNMLERADGKYVSKCDSNPRRLGIVRGVRPIGEHHAGGCGGASICRAAGAWRELQHPGARCGRAVCGGAASRDFGDCAGLRPQRAWPEHEGVHRSRGWVLGNAGQLNRFDC